MQDMNALGLPEFFEIPALDAEKAQNTTVKPDNFPDSLARKGGKFFARRQNEDADELAPAAQPVLYRLAKPQLARLVTFKSLTSRNTHWIGLPDITANEKKNQDQRGR